MQKNQFIAEIAARTGMKHKDVRILVDAFTDTVIDTLAAGDSVRLAGFGGFVPVKHAAKVCRNVKTGERITVPEGMSPRFKASKTFKDAVK